MLVCVCGVEGCVCLVGVVVVVVVGGGREEGEGQAAVKFYSQRVDVSRWCCVAKKSEETILCKGGGWVCVCCGEIKAVNGMG